MSCPEQDLSGQWPEPSGLLTVSKEQGFISGRCLYRAETDGNTDRSLVGSGVDIRSAP